MPKEFDCGAPIEPVRWTVKGLIPEGRLCILLAQSGVGKSFFLEAVAVSIAMEKSFCGFETVSGNVLIIDQDTPSDKLDIRIKKLVNGMGGKLKHKIIVSSYEGRYLSNNGLSELITDTPDLRFVVIDSFHSCCGYFNPNNTQDMTAFARFKTKCLPSGAKTTIAFTHHITEKLSLSIEQLMDKNTHLSGMGSSVIKQQADTEYVLASLLDGDRVDKVFIRPVPKRDTISTKPLIVKFIDPDEETLMLNFQGYFEPQMNEVEENIMLLMNTMLKELTVGEIRIEMGTKWGEKPIREALNSLEKKGRLIMSRHKSNLFKYYVPNPPSV